LNNILKDKIIIVTGAAGLLGKNVISGIIKSGGYGIICDNDEKKAKLLNEEIKSNRTDYHKMDITFKDSINEVIFNINKKYNKIDAIVNCAYPRNKNYGRKLEEVEYTDFCENLNLHLGGYFLTNQQFADFFKKQGWGNIVNISSIYGVIPPRFEIYDNTKMTMPVEYAAIKSALIHLTKYMAKYYKGKNIRFNCVSPGGLYNNQDESFLKSYNKYSLNKGMLDCNDIVGSIIFLLSDYSKYINGQNIIVDDGWTL